MVGLVLALGTVVVGAAPAQASAPAVGVPTVDRTTRTAPSVARLRQPMVIGHRGASGYRPEHTLAAYELAVRQGADAIEPDLMMTSDGVLVARHDAELSATTDVASRPELADRRTTRTVGSASVTGWFVEDLTLAELKTLRARERWPALRPGSATYDGRYAVPTFAEVLSLRARLSRSTGRSVAVVPELKNWASLSAAGLDPEAALVGDLERAGLNRRDAPVWTQSSQWTPLDDLRHTHGYLPRLVLVASVKGGPGDLASAGTPRTYADLLTPAGLHEIAQTVDAVAAEKGLVVPRRSDGRLGAPTSLVADAHAAGLAVFPWTFRAENTYLPVNLRVGSDPAGRGRMAAEVTAFVRAGVDGVFCDHPDVCVAGRAAARATRTRTSG